MSNIGLNSNIYHSTRVYLELLNNFLIDLNYSNEIGKPFKDKEVIQFFKKINESTNTDPEYQLIRSFFNRYFKENKKDMNFELRKILDHIINSNIDQEILKEVKALTDILKFQCAQAYARMKGTR